MRLFEYVLLLLAFCLTALPAVCQIQTFGPPHLGKNVERLEITREDSARIRHLLDSLDRKKVIRLEIFSNYIIGPKAGIYIPTQRRLLKYFHEADPYYSIAFTPVNPMGGISFSINYYNIENKASDGRLALGDEGGVLPRDAGGGRHRHENTFFLLGPAVGYVHWFKGNSNIRPYVNAEVEYLRGKLTVREEGLNTGLKGSFGADILIGALFSKRYKVSIDYAALKPVMGFSLSGITASLSYSFFPIGALYSN